jgi:hypothetical protein
MKHITIKIENLISIPVDIKYDENFTQKDAEKIIMNRIKAFLSVFDDLKTKTP